MRRWLKWLAITAVVFLALAQVFRPAKTNPAIDPGNEIGAVLHVDPAASSVLQRSCNDCHSNRTVWPWYSQIAPASWLVVHDVNHGREELNFSSWASYSAAKQRKKLSEICKEMTEGEMPELPYVLMHPSAKVGAADVAAVCRWTNEQSALVTRTY